MKVKCVVKNDLNFGPFSHDFVEIFIRLLTDSFLTFEPIFGLCILN